MAGNTNYATALLTATFEKYLSTQAADAIFEDLALFEWLNGAGSVKRRADGGVKLLEPLMYGKNTAGGSYSGYDEFDVSPQEGFTNAEFEYKQYYQTITISGEEEELNAGEAKVMDLLQMKWNQARMSLRDFLNIDAFLDGTGNSSKNITGLALMIDSAGTYGNIVRSTNSWWQAQETAVGGGLKVDSSTGMLRMYNDCSLGKKKMLPNFILTTQSVYEDYEMQLPPQLRYTTGGTANATFSNDNLMFRKAPMFWDEQCQSGIMYFLNSRVMQFVLKQGRDFKTRKFQTPANQDAKIAQILFMGELTASNCRHLGKLTGIT